MLMQAEKIHQLILIHSLLENYSFGELSSYASSLMSLF